jgi:2-dehydro-3-deoxygluconokinase
MTHKTLCFGELLLRLSAPHHLRLSQSPSLDVQFTGSEANVAVSLAKFGSHAGFITCVPDNDVGHMGLSTLKKLDVDTQLCMFSGDRLGLFYFEMGIGHRASKVLYDRAHSSMATISHGQIDWHKAFEGITWFHWSGITPAISQAAADATLEALRVAKALNITISCDLNYRSGLWKYGKQPSEIMPQLVQYCNLILGDGDTINTYFGIKENDYNQLALKTFEQFPALYYIALTARKAIHASHNTYKGFLHDKKAMHESKEYDIPDILDRLGTGDAFMAGLIHALQKKGEDVQYAADFSAASATLNHAIYGDFNLITEAEVIAVMQGNTGGNVSR